MSLRTVYRKYQQAFTLFEVLVALAILSITMVAAIVTTDHVLEKTVYLEKKLLAHFIGMNILNDYQLNMKAKKTDTTPNNSGKATMRNQEFAWVLNTTKTDFEGASLLMIEVKVSEVYGTNGADHDKNILDNVSRLIPIAKI